MYILGSAWVPDVWRRKYIKNHHFQSRRKLCTSLKKGHFPGNSPNSTNTCCRIRLPTSYASGRGENVVPKVPPEYGENSSLRYDLNLQFSFTKLFPKVLKLIVNILVDKTCIIYVNLNKNKTNTIGKRGRITRARIR